MLDHGPRDPPSRSIDAGDWLSEVPAFLRCLLAAPFAIASGLVVFDFKIGPVIMVGTTPGSGVHEGDLFFGVPLALIAVLLLALPGPKS